MPEPLLCKQCRFRLVVDSIERLMALSKYYLPLG
jgi:hypothetical protein